VTDCPWPPLEEQCRISQRLAPEVLFGTSTWTYPGWTGMVYREYTEKRSPAEALAEYACWPLFRTVGIDASFYRPLDERMLIAFRDALRPGMRCVSKVWDRITAHTFNSPREGKQRGERNPHWLDAELFVEQVLTPMQRHFAEHAGPLVFELETIPRHIAMTPDTLADHLDGFFTALPRGPQYAVELRNAELLTPIYLAVLRQHNVAHVFNAWTRMPSIGEQFLLQDAITADFMVVRALLVDQRKYADAVDRFSPYDQIRLTSPELRDDLVAVSRHAINLRIPAYVIINNRSEGCAPLTIAALAHRLIDDGSSAFATF
jgi:uncharacterized protein YecE (DUF72 family)